MIPKTLKIGGHRYRVLVVPKLDNEAMGRHSREDCEISISSNQSDSQAQETLLHEIIHAIQPAFSEETIEFLSLSLFQVLSDNKLDFSLRGKH